DAGDLALALQLSGDRDGVGRLAARGQIDDRVEDQLVRRAVEVASFEQVVGRVDGGLAQQHRPEHALLGGHVLRGSECVAGVIWRVGELSAQRMLTWTMTSR